ncbi:Protein-S-isoprenylcysteine O-methyltransferase Ste14 [Solimonas aquatica]|uniref:methanethiol S-methyltransferase n=1 Tax=Solimonas aquatica TaxID=489703 RepID=A0A1H9EHC0_9GAMM|nr:methanethiol S-methyltransferase [Solimonas aquatica]SEQ25114.1 Protein-S-isoprenylcysteine O-methyltransferase Ste14 [Solimonas aquatica]
MPRALVLAYGLICYAVFFLVFLYMVAFVVAIDGVVPRTLAPGEGGSLSSVLLVNLGLLLLFGVQHSVMARSSFKHRVSAWLPPPVERSTYVLATSLILMLIFAAWRPLPGMVWQASSPALVWGLWALNLCGWCIVLLATFLTNHFDLFGLRQVWLHWRRQSYQPVPFREWLFYRSIRHPMMLGLFIAFWATPQMSLNHLLFSAGMSIYILIGVHFEERALRRELGQPYCDYERRTGRFLPRLLPAGARQPQNVTG